MSWTLALLYMFSRLYLTRAPYLTISSGFVGLESGGCSGLRVWGA